MINAECGENCRLVLACHALMLDACFKTGFVKGRIEKRGAFLCKFYIENAGIVLNLVITFLGVPQLPNEFQSYEDCLLPTTLWIV